MLTTLETYRAIARNCAQAHKAVMAQGDDRAYATALFTDLWTRLGLETPFDRDSAKDEFNMAFGVAYRGRVAPAPAPRRSSAPRASAALDCAAFYRAKVGA